MTPDSPQDPQKDEAEVSEEAKAPPKPKKAKRARPKKAKAKATASAKAAEETKEAAAETTGGEGEAAAGDERSEAQPPPKRRRAAKAASTPEGTKPEGTEEPAAAAATDKETKEAAAAQPRKRDRRRRPEPGVLVRAQAKYVRTSARKARLVCDHIRGKDVVEARAILAFTPRAAAKPWLKLLESAVANAEHNHELVGDDLKIAAVHADEGPTLKRFRPRAMGRATRIRKRTSHLTITLTPKES
jgi:ribosomal protein L22